MIGECELPEFYTWSEPVARKEHWCIECAAPILVGERYFRYSGKWYGQLESGQQHLLCMEACILIRDEIEGDCVPFGELMEWFEEYRDDLGKKSDIAKRLRSLIAQIKQRERQGRPQDSTSRLDSESH